MFATFTMLAPLPRYGNRFQTLTPTSDCTLGRTRHDTQISAGYASRSTSIKIFAARRHAALKLLRKIFSPEDRKTEALRVRRAFIRCNRFDFLRSVLSPFKAPARPALSPSGNRNVIDRLLRLHAGSRRQHHHGTLCNQNAQAILTGLNAHRPIHVSSLKQHQLSVPAALR